MAPDPPHQRTQEQSIKARKHQLFEADEPLDSGPRRSFRDCLRETPAEPLSNPVKALLWTLGVVVVLLLVVALATAGHRKPKPRSVAALEPAAGSSTVPDPASRRAGVGGASTPDVRPGDTADPGKTARLLPGSRSSRVG